ncbi:MAG: hypothetical protein ACRENY_09610 [Candidatus Dormibacteria bacterium]
MPLAPTPETYEYRLADSLDEVNQLALEGRWDLFQAVAQEGRSLCFVLRRPRNLELGRRVGFAGRDERSGEG